MIKYSLLIVEDNPSLNQRLKTQFQPLFAVSQAVSVQQAQTFLESEEPFDIVLLDRHLPDGDGLTLLPFFAMFAPQSKICVLSQKDTLAEKLLGFEKGADAYLCKPINFKELRAQVLALTRRGRAYQKGHLVAYGPLILDTLCHTLTVLNHCLQLTPRESLVMNAFLDHPQAFLSIPQLYNLFWELGQEPSNSIVHVAIQRLRRKISPLRVTIQSHYGSGYQLLYQG